MLRTMFNHNVHIVIVATIALAIASLLATAAIAGPTAGEPAASGPATAAPAANAPAAASSRPAVRIPMFGNPNSRLERPDMSGAGTIRILTDDSFPPLNFVGDDNRPTGFTVDLARAACDRLGVACTIQTRRFDTLLDALAAGKGDVVIAAIPATPGLLERFTVTRPYMRFPGRFMIKNGAASPGPGEKDFAGKTIGVVAGSAHEAWLKANFPASPLKAYPDLPAAGAALRAGEVPYVFGDGLGMALWQDGSLSGNCCGFTGGPYLSDAFFGEGVGFIVRRNDAALQRAFDYALQQMWSDGRYDELYLRYFPVSFF
ncbi:ABC transporter substrate-binding protein [Camelimonas fluminis]|nr:ABC transporter substrate-binding protein [Camelimonas fluminis]